MSKKQTAILLALQICTSLLICGFWVKSTRSNRGLYKKRNNMARKIIIDAECCKGCGLCVIVCPKNSIVISKKSNKKGYFPAEATDSDCTGCCFCALICPDAVIEVFRENKVVGIESGKINKKSSVREKA